MNEYHLLFRVLITLVVAVVLSTSVRWLMKIFITRYAKNVALTLDKRTDEEKKRGVNKVAIRVISLGEYFILLRAYVWAANTDDAFAIQCDMNYSVKKRFYAVGVEIPFPYRNVIVKKEHRCIVETKS